MDLSLNSQNEFAKHAAEIRKLFNKVKDTKGLPDNLDIDYGKLTEQLKIESVAKATDYEPASFSQFLYGDTLQRIETLLNLADGYKTKSESGIPINEADYFAIQHELGVANNRLIQILQTSRAKNTTCIKLVNDLAKAIRRTARVCFRAGYQEEVSILNASIADKMAGMMEEQTKIAANSEKQAKAMTYMTIALLISTLISMAAAITSCACTF